MWWIIAVFLKFGIEQLSATSSFFVGFVMFMAITPHCNYVYFFSGQGILGGSTLHVMLFSPWFLGKLHSDHHVATSPNGSHHSTGVLHPTMAKKGYGDSFSCRDKSRTMPRVNQLTPLPVSGMLGAVPVMFQLHSWRKRKNHDYQLKIVTAVIKCLQSSTSW